MEGTSEHSLVPQWLMKNSGRVATMNTQQQLTSSPYSPDHSSYSGHRWSSSSKGSSLSRSYSSSGRSWNRRDWEIDIDNFFHNDKLFLGQGNNDSSDYVNDTFSGMLEKDLLQRSKSMNSGRWRETCFDRTSGDVSNPQRNHGKKTNGMVTGVFGIVHRSVLDEEFPSLGAEDKHGNYELEKMLSSSSSTLSHGMLTDTSAVIVSNGLASASHEIPVTVGNTSMAVMMHQHNDSASTSSSTCIAPRTMGLNMAETLAHGQHRSHTPPQLSVSTQKLEELAFKQSRLLIPMTPSTPRSLAASFLEKSKVKTGQLQYPFSHSHSSSHSLHGAHPNSHIQKIISGNSHDVGASRESNGVSLAAKDNLSPNGSRVVGTTASTSISASSRSASNSTPSAWITLEKRPAFQTQSRSDFLKNLSRKSSSKKPCSDVFPMGMSCALEKSEASTRNDTSCLTLKSRDASSVDNAAANSLTEHSSIVITQNGNVPGEPLKQQFSGNPILCSEEEEIAFLRSLGWEENAGDDEGLTEEEIQDFYDKYVKLQL